MINPHCYFYATIDIFLKTSESDILASLKTGSEKLYKKAVEESQITAWKDEISVLEKTVIDLPHNWIIILEYILPREAGRRPDVILLTGKEILVLEFKQFEEEHWSHIDQVIGYTRDLREYQSYCHNKEVIPFLILTKTQNKEKKYKNVQVLSSEKLPDYLFRYKNEIEQIDPLLFLEGKYQPLPTIIEAAKTIFNREPLPQIKSAKSSKIDETLAFLQDKADEALEKHQNLLMLVTGVPGAGKTLVGLQFAFNNSSRKAVLLSGNRPLIEVLQSIFGKASTNLVHNVLDDYNKNPKLIPNEAIIIYDEAQRAWDEKQSKKLGRDCSEPEDLIRLVKRRSENGEGTVLVGLIGEGQAIYLGEEAGIEQWNTAIKGSDLKWQIFCPTHLASYFEQPIKKEELNLSVSLRSKSALQLPNWIEAVLAGDSQKAKKIYGTICNEFPIHITRKFNEAKEYLKNRYERESSKLYGVIISSQACNYNRYEVDKDLKLIGVGKDDLGPWFSEKSCCQLNKYITEFQVQGLELDFPLICWGSDFSWDGEKWCLRFANDYINGQLTDPFLIRQNAYRVLLSRGREGMFIFVPNKFIMNETYDFLKKCLGKN